MLVKDNFLIWKALPKGNCAPMFLLKTEELKEISVAKDLKPF